MLLGSDKGTKDSSKEHIHKARSKGASSGARSKQA